MNKPFKDTIGLDIRDSALTAVELSASKKGLKVINFSRVELEPDVVDENCIIVNPDAFKSAMNRLMQEAYAGPMKAKNVIISIPEEKTFTHNLCIPHENSNEDNIITDSARDFIPIELSEAATDYRILGACSSSKEHKYNFVAVQKSIVQSLIDTLYEIGLKVVFVDVDKNSMMRACHNRFQNTSDDFMVVNIDEELTTFSINSTTTNVSYTLDSEIAGSKIIETVKEKTNVPTATDAKKILDELFSNPDMQEDDKYTGIGIAMQEPLDSLLKNIQELVNVAGNQESIKVKTIYLIGSHSRLPGIKEMLKKAFPDANIIQNFQYIQLNESTELYYAEAIGLALRAVLPEAEESEINLLPKDDKEELVTRMLTPIMTRLLFTSTILLAALLVFSGMMTAKSFIDLKVSDKELEISNEETQNPYLHRTAQNTQQRTQLASQLDTILKDSIPAGYFMKDMDKYNKDGIGLISVSYKLNNDSSNNIRLRAKTLARSETEKFIAALEDNPNFTNIISPLSNLTGKGERFINIDIQVAMDVLRDAFNKEYGLLKAEVSDTEETAEDKSKPKRPSIKTDEPSSDGSSEASEPIVEPIEESEPVETQNSASLEGDDEEKQPIEDTIEEPAEAEPELAEPDVIEENTDAEGTDNS